MLDPLRRRLAALAALALAAAAPFAAAQDGPPRFTVAWSIYVGWMPWGYIEETGIIDSWAEREGIEIEIVRMDYIESLEAYAAGEVHGVTATNMDTLAIPVAEGRDTTVVIVGDHSSGNDAVILKEGMAPGDLAGKRIGLVPLSVSHYLLARALEAAGLPASSVEIVEVSDAEMVARYGDGDLDGVVTWNPLVAEIAAREDATIVYDSADIPGEIMDLLVVDTETLSAHPGLGRALAGAWYEAMRLMADPGPRGVAAREAMAAAAGADLSGFESQLFTTRMFYDPAEAVFFAEYDEVAPMMAEVTEFLAANDLIAAGADGVGIAFPDGTVAGDRERVLMRFETGYMRGAAEAAGG